jgi:hypothetical protein
MTGFFIPKREKLVFLSAGNKKISATAGCWFYSSTDPLYRITSVILWNKKISATAGCWFYSSTDPHFRITPVNLGNKKSLQL